MLLLVTTTTVQLKKLLYFFSYQAIFTRKSCCVTLLANIWRLKIGHFFHEGRVFLGCGDPFELKFGPELHFMNI